MYIYIYIYMKESYKHLREVNANQQAQNVI